ncbi:MAG: hypothetical protein AAGB48_09040 [Planctomycetota bacterium]
MDQNATPRTRLRRPILPAAATLSCALLVPSGGCTTRVPELLTSNRGPVIKPARLAEPTPIDRFADSGKTAGRP